MHGSCFVWRVQQRVSTDSAGKPMVWHEAEFADAEEGREGRFCVVTCSAEAAECFVGRGDYEVFVEFRTRDVRTGVRVVGMVLASTWAASQGAASEGAAKSAGGAVRGASVSGDAGSAAVADSLAEELPG